MQLTLVPARVVIQPGARLIKIGARRSLRPHAFDQFRQQTRNPANFESWQPADFAKVVQTSSPSKPKLR